MMSHVPEPRNDGNLKPYLLIVNGPTKVGKTTLSKTMMGSGDFSYYCTDKFIIDPNIPIPSITKAVGRLNGRAILCIPEFESLVIKNQDTFIDYCYDVINGNKKNSVIEGVLFNHESFLKKFKDKFNGEFKIWVISPIN